MFVCSVVSTKISKADPVVQLLAAPSFTQRVVGSIPASSKRSRDEQFCLLFVWVFIIYICLNLNVYKYVCQCLVPIVMGILIWGRMPVRDFFLIYLLLSFIYLYTDPKSKYVKDFASIRSQDQ